MFFKLPTCIITKIYEYDTTYHLKYKIVLSAFIKHTSFWRMMSDREMEESVWYYNNNITKYPFNMTYKMVKSLAHYWNYDYKHDKSLGHWHNKWSKNYQADKKEYKYPQHLMDVDYKNGLIRLFNNIKNEKNV